MREIKFRAWHKAKKKYIYFGLRDLDGDYIVTGSCYFDDCEPVEQDIGLKDKNGKEIHKGDKYQIANHHIYVVSYCEKEEHDFELLAAMFVLKADHATFPFDDYALSTGEIIGHIHE